MFNRLPLLLMALVLCASAQTLTLTGSPAQPGAAAAMDLTLASAPTGTGALADLQWSITVPPGITLTATAGAASTAASKQITCAQVSTAYNCVATGMNTNQYTSGVVAHITFTAPSSPGSIPFPCPAGSPCWDPPWQATL